MVYCNVSSRICTFTVRDSTGPHSGYTQPVVPVRPYTSESCTDTYSVCGTIPFEWQYFFWVLCCQAYFWNRAAMRIFGIVQLLYGLWRDPIICVHSLIKLCTYVCQRASKIRIIQSQKYHLRHCPHVVVGHCHVYFRNRTTTVRGATEPHNLCTQTVVPLSQCTTGSCTACVEQCHLTDSTSFRV